MLEQEAEENSQKLQTVKNTLDLQVKHFQISPKPTSHRMGYCRSICLNVSTKRIIIAV